METKSIAYIFLFHVVVCGISLTIAQPIGPKQQIAKCRDTGNFQNDKLQQYRDAILDNIGKYKMSVLDNGYFTARIYYDFGHGLRGIHAMALCPPNVKVDSCKRCVLNTIPFLKQTCPKKNEGMAWSSLPELNCMMRYAVGFFEGTLSDWGWAEFSNKDKNVPNAGELEKAMNDLTTKLKEEAAAGTSKRKYASGIVTYGPSKRTLYGAMQCTPDLSKEDCAKCLSGAALAVIGCCAKTGKFSARTLTTSCYARYSHENFIRQT